MLGRISTLEDQVLICRMHQSHFPEKSHSTSLGHNQVSPARMPSKCEISSPSALASFLSMRAETALTTTAFKTRLEPWRARNGQIYAPPVECQTSLAFLRSRCSKREGDRLSRRQCRFLPRVG
jgi:hypothetical protein